MINKKLFAMLMACFLVVSLLLIFRPKDNSPVYRDSINQVSFSYPEQWKISPSNNYIKLDSNPSNYLETNVLVTVNPNPFIIQSLGLDKQELVKLGDKNIQIIHKDNKVIDSDKIITFTHVYWKADDNHKYWFQISPKQEGGFSDEVERFLISFSPNE
ncbi:MAG: hypothetical protein HYT62_05050 [Candidatus Yanofskybacteria bacterium]|nr:hypothetical protein [Candidatus Yanofskybacteria bacterium]